MWFCNLLGRTELIRVRSLRGIIYWTFNVFVLFRIHHKVALFDPGDHVNAALMAFAFKRSVEPAFGDQGCQAAGDDARGRLSVMLQYRFKVEKRFDVPPTAFKPVPAVDSSIVRLTPLGSARLRPKDETLFARIVNEAFSQRRKMLRKSLAKWVTPAGWEAIGVAPTARAEELTCDAFVAISDWAGVHRNTL